MGLREWSTTMLVSGGLFTGGVAWYAWERVWIWRAMPLDQYAVDFRRSLRKADPPLPILLVVCAGAAVGFALEATGTPRHLAFVAILLLAAVLLGSLLLAEPMNSQFRRRPEGEPPPAVGELRTRWRSFHLVRTALAVPAFVCLAAAASWA